MGFTNPFHQGRPAFTVLDMCWCKKRPLPKKHERHCAKERKRRGLK